MSENVDNNAILSRTKKGGVEVVLRLSDAQCADLMANLTNVTGTGEKSANSKNGANQPRDRVQIDSACPNCYKYLTELPHLESRILLNRELSVVISYYCDGCGHDWHREQDFWLVRKPQVKHDE